MEPQEIYDTVVRHLKMQGRRAIFGASCRYRVPRPDGTTLKCAVGALIPDELYRAWMDGPLGGAIGDVVAFKDCPLPEWFRAEAALLADLQRAHDLAKHWNEQGLTSHAISELRGIATNHLLSAEVLDECFPEYAQTTAAAAQ